MTVVRMREGMLEESKGNRDRRCMLSFLVDSFEVRSRDTSCSSCI